MQAIVPGASRLPRSRLLFSPDRAILRSKDEGAFPGIGAIQIRQPDYADVDQLIRANAVSLAKGNFAPAILADDRDGAIRRILERTLRIKKILQRHGREETIKNILIDFVKSYCHLINLRHGFYTLCDDTLDDDDMPLCDCAELPYTLHLPNICHRPDMWRSYDLERHPEKIINLPLPIFYDARGRAKYHALSATERGDGTVEDARQGKQISEASG